MKIRESFLWKLASSLSLKALREKAWLSVGLGASDGKWKKLLEVLLAHGMMILVSSL